MRRGNYRSTGSAWVGGLGILGLLVTTAIIIVMFKGQAETMFNPGTGTIRAQDQAKKVLEQVNVHNTDVDKSIAQEEKPAPVAPKVATTMPSAPPAVPAPAASPSASGGTPSGGQVIGPPSPVSPIAPIQEGSGPNLKGVRGHVDGVTNATDDHNKELEKAMEEK